MTAAAGSAGPSPVRPPPGASTVRLPEPLPGPALDAHTHLDMVAGAAVAGGERPADAVAGGERPADAVAAEVLAEVLAEARAVGITRVVTVGVDLATSRWVADCALAHAGVYAAVAIHPNETARAATSAVGRDAVLAEIRALAALPQVRAVGETGLDYFRDWAPPRVQREWFRGHIEIAKRTGKALMIHDRDAHEDVLSILAADGAPERVIFHCFSGDAAMAKLCADAGYLMSFAGNVTFASAQQLREAAAVAPPELILVETDAPFLTPAPNRGKPNAPALVADTLRALAELKQMDTAELCAAVVANAERVFGPMDPGSG